MIDGDPVNKKIPLSGCMPQRKGGIVLQKIAFAAPVPSPGGEAAALPAVEGLSHVNLCSEWEGERAQTAHLLSCLMHSHLCVVTRDMEKTLAYYERVLGAKPSRHVLRCPYTYAAANAYPKGAVYALIRGGQAEQDLRGAKTGGKILEFKSPGEKEIRIGFASLPGSGLTLQVIEWPEEKPRDPHAPPMYSVALRVSNLGAALSHIARQADTRLLHSEPLCRETDVHMQYFGFLDPYGLRWELEQKENAAWA